jgi:hypothetical protein
MDRSSDVMIFKESDRYVAQDFSWNSRDGNFRLNLCQNIFNGHAISEVNQHLLLNVAGANAMASLQTPQLSVIIHCKCKKGKPTRNFSVRFHDGIHLTVQWEGVTRLFARVRIMESVTMEGLRNILADDIENRHSISDVDEDADDNHCFRPWSDDEDCSCEDPDPNNGESEICPIYL